MFPCSKKKPPKTYSSRTAKRALYDEEPPTKRRRVAEPQTQRTTVSPLRDTSTPAPADTSSPTRTVSAPLSSSPQPTFSDTAARSSPPSSPPAPERSSPPALPDPEVTAASGSKAARRPVFSLFWRKLKHSVSLPEPLSERSQSAANTCPAPQPPAHPPAKKRLVQMQLDLAPQHRRACTACGMEYIPSNAADVALHKKFHAENRGGVDCTRAMVERLRAKQVWSGGGEGAFVAGIGRRDALVLRRKAVEVLGVVNSELAAVGIGEEELWGQVGLGEGNAEEKCDRFKVFLYVQGLKCVGACLAERIEEAYPVLAQDEAETKTSEQEQSLVRESHSSSISVGTTASPVFLGISRIWVSNQFRKQGLARTLLDCARSNFMYGLTVEKRQMAFSQPTESGGKLARRYFGCEAGWHVYMD
ncbi:N-acetyltransferase O1 (Establishment of cohesion protein 1) [Curvularia kusanoi]|uniref:N-acetyltransferase O1 (Establishment of cohesion protein 1) n=1 Tax=Curvularia kusanoi TaxID=90978 RepID=A0A9P4TGB9_CURKU|nr:N-acetyltransferase O1 (Establishment of cohesion protein 1) [Curvularia kusanoi]